MEKRKTKALTLIVVLIACCVGIVLASVCWQRQVTISFDVHGINAELLQYGSDPYNNYRNKTVATSLDSNNQAVITIYSENFHDIFLNCSYVSNATMGGGVQINITGQYLSYQWVMTGMAWQGVITKIGSAFSINGYNVINKTTMMYQDPGINPSGPVGYGLLVTVTPETAEYPYGGHYYATITFALGFT